VPTHAFIRGVKLRNCGRTRPACQLPSAAEEDHAQACLPEAETHVRRDVGDVQRREQAGRHQDALAILLPRVRQRLAAQEHVVDGEALPRPARVSAPRRSDTDRAQALDSSRAAPQRESG